MRGWIALLTICCAGQLYSDTNRSTISIIELSHRPPSSALRDYRESAKSFKAGDVAAALERLEHGLALDPKNVAAHNDLGILYLETNQPLKALREFERMLELDPRSAAGRRNLSSAFLALKRFPEAEEAARKALELDSGSSTAHLLLGFSLIGQHKYNSETLRCLRRAAEEFSEALLAVADVLVRLGQPEEARQQVERYMQSAEPAQKDLGRVLLRMLTLE